MQPSSKSSRPQSPHRLWTALVLACAAAGLIATACGDSETTVTAPAATEQDLKLPDGGHLHFHFDGSFPPFPQFDGNFPPFPPLPQFDASFPPFPSFDGGFPITGLPMCDGGTYVLNGTNPPKLVILHDGGIFQPPYFCFE